MHVSTVQQRNSVLRRMACFCFMRLRKSLSRCWRSDKRGEGGGGQKGKQSSRSQTFHVRLHCA